ncbi:hypothetical protein BJ742DRAFT_767458 [Cladochytrium replicatum]|nr:hypothetical protein BJ742DRAFT_767458 [Cladochytrium replicatum]
MTSKIASPVVLDYEDLKNGKDFRDRMLEAFGYGPDALSICIVKKVPHSSRNAKHSCHTPPPIQSSYIFGWCHGKEIMNGKPDA